MNNQHTFHIIYVNTRLLLIKFPYHDTCVLVTFEGRTSLKAFENLQIRKIEIYVQSDVRYKKKSKPCSQFVVDAYDEWIPEWSSSGWSISDDSEDINRKEFQELVRTFKHFCVAVELEHVRSHQNNQLNIEADRLAKLCAQGKSSH